MKNNGKRINLKISGNLVIERLEKLLAVDLRIGTADQTALRGIAMSQDGDDQSLVCAPSYKDIEQRDESELDREMDIVRSG